jgi:hypothetical protein
MWFRAHVVLVEESINCIDLNFFAKQNTSDPSHRPPSHWNWKKLLEKRVCLGTVTRSDAGNGNQVGELEEIRTLELPQQTLGHDVVLGNVIFDRKRVHMCPAFKTDEVVRIVKNQQELAPIDNPPTKTLELPVVVTSGPARGRSGTVKLEHDDKLNILMNNGRASPFILKASDLASGSKDKQHLNLSRTNKKLIVKTKMPRNLFGRFSLKSKNEDETIFVSWRNLKLDEGQIRPKKIDQHTEQEELNEQIVAFGNVILKLDSSEQRSCAIGKIKPMERCLRSCIDLADDVLAPFGICCVYKHFPLLEHAGWVV